MLGMPVQTAMAADASDSGKAGLKAGFEPAGAVLEQHCFKCHSHASGKSKGGLLLDSHAAIMEGGESGPAVVPFWKPCMVLPVITKPLPVAVCLIPTIGEVVPVVEVIVPPVPKLVTFTV